MESKRTTFKNRIPNRKSFTENTLRSEKEGKICRKSHEDLEDKSQSCICDPKFTNHESSTSISSYASEGQDRSWLPYDTEEITNNLNDEKTHYKVVLENTDSNMFLDRRTNLAKLRNFDKISMKNSAQYSLLGKKIDNLQPTSETKWIEKKQLVSKVPRLRKGVDPLVNNLLEESKQNLFTKLAIEGYENCDNCFYSSDYITDSDDSSSKQIIKSILKRGGAIQIGDNPKKKVRFNLNKEAFFSGSSTNYEISSLAGQTLNFKSKTAGHLSLSRLQEQRKYILLRNKLEKKKTVSSIKLAKSVSPTKGNEINHKTDIEKDNNPVAGPEEEQPNYSGNKNRDSMCSNVLNNSEPKKNFKSEILKCDAAGDKLMHIGKLDPEINNKNTNLGDISKCEILTQPSLIINKQEPNHHETITEKTLQINKHLNEETSSDTPATSIPLENESQALKFNQPGNTENDYSPFIKDLVTGSGDRLTNFLMTLSSEILNKAGQENINNTLLNVGLLVKENLENQNTTKKEFSQCGETLILPQNNSKEINSPSKKSDSSKKRPLIKVRKSMSEINIHELNTKLPQYNSYLSSKIRASSYIKLSSFSQQKSQSAWEKNSINNYKDDSIRQLHELMNDLKEKMDNLCKKESTIRIENAQIWIKENKITEQKLSEKIFSKEQQNRRETHSQTIETIDALHLYNDFQRGVGSQGRNKTEIHIVSSSKSEEINIKLNEMKLQTNDLILSFEPRELTRSYSSSNLMSSREMMTDEEERKRYFEENDHVPFNVVFNDKTQLPVLKKGKYELEIFEKVEDPTFKETNVKNVLKKLTEQINGLKLNGLHSNRYEKTPNKRHISCTVSKTSQNVDDKGATSIIQTFLNRIIRAKDNFHKKYPCKLYTKPPTMDSKDKRGFLESILSVYNNDGKCSDGKSRARNANKGIQQSEQFSFKNANHESKCLNQCDEQQWPDIVKTKYPNGMVHFGPLTLMPEPDIPSTTYHHMKCIDLENYLTPYQEDPNQYIFKQQTLETSVSRTFDDINDQTISLGEFSETEQTIYHKWSQVENL